MTQVDWIHFRKSVRKFKKNQMETSFFDELNITIKEVENIIEDRSYDVHVIKDGEAVKKMLAGFASKYTYVKAPHYLLLTCKNRVDDVFNLGYIGEQVVKYLTLKNFGTCWIGAKTDFSKLGTIADLNKSHDFTILIGFGEPVTPLSFIRNRKRKAISEVFYGYESLSDTERFIAEAVSTAPSAMNNQPWRFYLNNGLWDYYKAIPKGFFAKALSGYVTLDAGIGLYHVIETARILGSTVTFEKMDFHENDQNYLGTLKVED